jgi:hypothetical protein
MKRTPQPKGRLALLAAPLVPAVLTLALSACAGAAPTSSSRPISTGAGTTSHLLSISRPPTKPVCRISIKPSNPAPDQPVTATLSVTLPFPPPSGLLNAEKEFNVGVYPIQIPGLHPAIPVPEKSKKSSATFGFALPEPGKYLIKGWVTDKQPNGAIVTICQAQQYVQVGKPLVASSSPAPTASSPVPSKSGSPTPAPTPA